MSEKADSEDRAPVEAQPEYDPPAVEQAISRDELAREMLYAGDPDPSRGPG
jgi:hypothetical protein